MFVDIMNICLRTLGVGGSCVNYNLNLCDCLRKFISHKLCQFIMHRHQFPTMGLTK